MSLLKPKLFSLLKTYTKEQFMKDLIAGIIVAIIALPLSIALAIASGVNPERGLHTAIIAGFLISFFGGSRVQIGGPTGAFMVIVYGIVTKFGIDGLIMATIMAGIIMIFMGLLKLGSVIKFIPYPITTGFTSGIALTIFSSQIKDFMGLQLSDVPAEFIPKWKLYLSNLHTINIETTIIGLIALIIIILWPKVNDKIPGALIALIVTSLIVKFMGLEVATIGSKFNELSSAFPMPSIPAFSIEKINLLIGPAFTIAILGSIESLLSAVVSDGMIGSKHRSNMELVAQGIANIGSGLFGGIPATGAIARTVANIKNGGRTPVAGIVHAITLFLIMVVFMPFAKAVPLASLAAILIVVSYNMSEWREFKELFKSPKSDIAVLLVTFFITVLIDLVKAIEIGVILASLLFMKRMADVTSIDEVMMDASEEVDENSFDFEKESNKLKLPKDVLVYEINGPFFFGAADKFLDVIKEVSLETKVIVFRMRNVPSMDATAINAFKVLINICKKEKIDIKITGLQRQPRIALKKANLYEIIGQSNFYDDVDKVLKDLNK